jgi:hypothetical protein
VSEPKIGDKVWLTPNAAVTLNGGDPREGEITGITHLESQVRVSFGGAATAWAKSHFHFTRRESLEAWRDHYRALLEPIEAEIARYRTRCSVGFEHQPHDFCDGNPGAKFINWKKPEDGK